MNKKECPSCAVEIEIKENICPICGYEFPIRKNYPLKISAVVLLILFLYIIFRNIF